MKIVAVLGSPNGEKGNTGALLALVLQGAEKRGAGTEIITIRKDEIKPCVACDVCHKKGGCPQKDKYEEIKDKIMKADGLVLATPNYIFHVSAQLKAFIDRCCSVVHCLGFEGKYGASVVTAGGGEEEPIADYLEHFLAITGAVPVGSVWATMSQVEGQNFPPDVRDKAIALGERLVEAWAAREKSPAYEPVTEQFRERMRSLILWRKEEWPFEYEYWKECRGLMEVNAG